ncbi:MAG: DUF2264 domain-containing protein [Bacteroidaceae bacterium]|nr:DUF2264 domain-containing protein [Bacteroidaceae bacterium]
MRRLLLILSVLLFAAGMAMAGGKKKVQMAENPLGDGQSDRAYWVELAYTMAAPVLENMAKGTLQQNMKLELSPTWDNRDKKVAYMECFGRLMAGIAPWLTLPDDDTPEGLKRKQLREWALQAYKNAVDPESSDYLGWTSGGQTLVDAAYVVESLFRGYSALWEPLDSLTKARYIKELQGLRRYDPPYTNWLLFVGMEESFLMYAGGGYDAFRIKMAMSKAEEWYIGDGLYSDGPSFAFDYYNAYVIQPMYTECLQMISARQGNNTYLIRSHGDNRNGATNRLKEVVKRMQKYSVILERFISPEGTFPVVGRSIPYRLAVLQPLAQLAWMKQLPEELHNGQVRAGITAVMKRMFEGKGASNFTKDGYLTIGFVGSHPNVADWYTNNGSLYMTSLAFMPLGLPADDPFWTDAPEKWTSKKAWEGDDFPKDHKWNINRQMLYWE